MSEEIKAIDYFKNINWDMLLNECEDPTGELVKRAELFSEAKGIQLIKEHMNSAPVLIHNRFCGRLVEIAKQHPQKLPKDIPEAMRVLKSIEVLEELYPQLKEL